MIFVCSVDLCHGNTENSNLELHYENTEVVVLTPQILLNTLLVSGMI